MALTLSKVMAATWRKLGHTTDITATGGSTTTVIDTTLSTRFTSDDALIGGTAIVTYDSGGLGAAPEGEFQRIADYVASTTTFTTAAFSAAVAAGDKVTLVNPKIAHEQMRQAVNDGLADLGTITLVDTSLTTADDQTEYALPVGLKIKRLIDIQLQGTLADANDNLYQSIISQSRYTPSAPGSTGLLTLPQLASGYTLKIIYEGVHPALTTYSSVVSETIQEGLAVAATINEALTWLASKRGDSALGTFLLQRWYDAKTILQQQKVDKPIYRMKPKAKWFVANGPISSENLPADL
jgi:hypothetical protein